ncbi:RAC-beta serine/threonine-protein kinase [Echinococcus granulosus]|uniref:RAC-beta serine/threonine-protein kinase n=1 Tax=Echinococcus granulosus TaxID=6210 RepID=W6UW17_ECHGR|nr:RAC-beta serine/threonine-protein kinase [Echinococcus granulosus]EUB57674.1 RAC-beta serine/threonine-protein kinase [Echinococcus granulosus]
MQSKKFDVVKFISCGTYSIVYEVAYPQRNKEKVTATMTTKWALKRIYLQNESAVRCALREHRILVRLALAKEQSPFLGTLLQSFRIHGGPAFVLRKGSGFDLQDLISNVGFLGETNARFYSSEIVCGLEYLHAIHIVHMDVKPTNMLIADSGHLFITDFDRSYDMARDVGPPKKEDFTGAPFYMAPEIKNQVEITTRADVWSLGILMACIMYGHVTVHNWLCTGLLLEDCLPNASIPLRNFFKACLRRNHNTRVDIGGVKRLEFYKDVKWEEVVACTMKPPYHPSKLAVFTPRRKYNLNPYDSRLLAAAYETNMPLIVQSLRCIRDKHGVHAKKGMDLEDTVECENTAHQHDLCQDQHPPIVLTDGMHSRGNRYMCMAVLLKRSLPS